MNRRRFLGSALAVSGSTLIQGNAHALLNCSPFVPPGIQQCEAGIDSNIAAVVANAVGGQHMNQ